LAAALHIHKSNAAAKSKSLYIPDLYRNCQCSPYEVFWLNSSLGSYVRHDITINLKAFRAYTQRKLA